MRLQRSPVGWIAEAPAKINLFFEVLGRRSDGFHEIVSIAVPIRLFDTLSFELTDDSSIQFNCVRACSNVPAERGLPPVGVPVDETNLVVRAVKCIQERYDIRLGAAITLIKRIPNQAGLGGGSSDAAAAMRLACRIWNLDVPDSELLPLAAGLGSDCPLFFYDTPTISKGRGELVQPLPALPVLWLILLKPLEGLSTAAVYAECMPLHDGQFRQPDDLAAAMSSGDVRAIGQNLFNRLEVSAQKLWHRFGEVRRQLLSAGCLAVQLSGSGTAFFGLCENEAHAKESLRRIRPSLSEGDEIFVVRTV